MKKALIGIVGCYGKIGRSVARRLHQWQSGQLRLGGRRQEHVQQVVDHELFGIGEVYTLDIDDPNSLAKFCADCQVVVNCAGPSWRIQDKVASIALKLGANYVDAAGDEPLYQLLDKEFQPLEKQIVLLSSGMLPGLSGLLLRYLAHYFDRPERLKAYSGVLDRFTFSGASDYLAGLDRSESLAAWQNHRRVSRALTRLVDIELPFFPSRVTAHPYLSYEGERLAQLLKLEQAHWYNVFDGNHLLSTLNRLFSCTISGSALDSSVVELMRAAELDVAGRTPYQLFLMELEGKLSGQLQKRSLMLGSLSAIELTSSITALATDVLLSGQIPSGIHFAAEVLDPLEAMLRIQKLETVTGFEIIEESVFGTSNIEEGIL
jgi:hypothetical protein